MSRHRHSSHAQPSEHSNGGPEEAGEATLAQPHHPHSHPHSGHHHASVSPDHFDLAQAALDEMHAAGFHPEFGPDVDEQVNAIQADLAQQNTQAKPGSLPDLRNLIWSSIDNDTSRDLDQIEVAERVPAGIRLHVAIGDVTGAVTKDSPIDKHAHAQTQTIYTAVRQFPMLPFELSTGATSLNENADRTAVMMSFTVAIDGQMSDEQISCAWVQNRAQLAYSRVGPWLDNTVQNTEKTLGNPEKIRALRSDSARDAEQFGQAAFGAGMDERAFGEALAEQLRMQDEAAYALRKVREQNGALEFHRAEAEPVVVDGRIASVHDVLQNRAMYLIEDLMVAANGVMARALRRGGRSGLQRVVRVPRRWDRIVALAAQHDWELPANPDSLALNQFLKHQRATDSDHYPDIAVATIKLMGPGEYMLMRPNDDPTGHFGLAARDYTHSTAPNRRFPDIVTQRILHAMIDNAPPPYTDDELTAIAAHCNEADSALRKIERNMQKRVAAVAMAHRIGEIFRGVITGVSDKGVYVRVIEPPFEGRVIQNPDGLDVGDRVSVKLLHTDPARAFIDFARVPNGQNNSSTHHEPSR
ncbi:MAG TPA: RNB domain-containing ribonuclease [Acidobacteriaceae bacterium]|jgi:exoribonuclease-2|nr:RNB domain-containing ribonuclease [Acidobacteriaceae bacterium]